MKRLLPLLTPQSQTGVIHARFAIYFLVCVHRHLQESWTVYSFERAPENLDRPVFPRPLRSSTLYLGGGARLDMYIIWSVILSYTLRRNGKTIQVVPKQATLILYYHETFVVLDSTTAQYNNNEIEQRTRDHRPAHPLPCTEKRPKTA